MKNYFNIINVFIDYFSHATWDDVFSKWKESHRYYHNITHLNFLFEEIEKLHHNGEIEDNEFSTLIIAAMFHDAIYDPKSKYNEEHSLNYFLEKCYNNDLDDDFLVKRVGEIIMATASRKEPEEKLSKIFWRLDNNMFTLPISKMIEIERKIFKEFQWVAYDKYKEGRIEFLKTCLGIFGGEYDNNIKELINYVNDREIHIGVYAGSFNPFHVGHMNILEKAFPMFDKVVVAFGHNPDKPKSEKVYPKALDYIHRLEYSGLITELLDTLETRGATVTLLRGIRNGVDLSYESNQNSYIQDMRPNTNIVYIPADKQFEHVSSSGIRSLMKYNEEHAKKYIVW